MTHNADNSERDAALDAAWREHSSEMPPSRLDAAILAAAHRAAGSGPQPVVAQGAGLADVDARTRAATGPQRWWMPLAAAATIGAIALGILQTMPQHDSAIAPSVSDMPAQAVERTAPLPDTPRNVLSPKEKRGAANTLAETDASRAPAVAVPPTAASASEVRKQAAKAATPPAKDLIAPPPASLAVAPQPFPADKKTDAGESAESAEMKIRAHAATASESAAAPPVAQYSELARKDERQRSEPLPSPPAAAGTMALGKAAANSAAPARAIDVDAWIVRIRKLHDDGKLADAARELVELRQAIPDVDGRLPPELHAWAATVKP